MHASTSTLPLLPLARPAALAASFPSAASPVSPRKRLALPHFTNSNGANFKSPQHHHHSSNPERLEPQDAPPKALDKTTDELHATANRIRSCFERVNQTQEIFEYELDETNAVMDKLHLEQQHIAAMHYNYFNFSALQIQRLFRRYLGRCVYRQAMALKTALRIQRGFRAMRKRRQERRKQFRVLCRKILRGMRGIREKEELSHKELLNRVNHNMMIETQWRKTMGVGDTESNLINALYRKKFMRKRIGAIFRHIFWTHSVVNYWHSLVQEPEPVDTSALEGLDAGEVSPASEGDEENQADLLEWSQQQLALSTTPARLRLVEAQQKIAAQVLSDETQQILKRKQRSSNRKLDNAANAAATPRKD